MRVVLTVLARAALCGMLRWGLACGVAMAVVFTAIAAAVRVHCPLEQMAAVGLAFGALLIGPLVGSSLATARATRRHPGIRMWHGALFGAVFGAVAALVGAVSTCLVIVLLDARERFDYAAVAVSAAPLGAVVGGLVCALWRASPADGAEPRETHPGSASLHHACAGTSRVRGRGSGSAFQ